LDAGFGPDPEAIGGLVDLGRLGDNASFDVLRIALAGGATAMLAIPAMTLGLVVPKMSIEYFWPGLAKPCPRDSRESRDVRNL